MRELGELPYKHQGRIHYEQVLKFHKTKKEAQQRKLRDMMRDDEAAGLYDA